MTIALGIDTGGTYTDAVLVDPANGDVFAGAKALTTHHDLALGIGEAVAAVFADQNVAPGGVGLVGLSTTLATNAIVEGRGSPVALILIGYDPELVRQYGFERELVTENVVYVRGGHDGEGEEVAPLDEGGVREAVRAYRDRVESFAVSGYFGVRNPAHEIRARELIRELTASPNGPLPVTCGHELTTRLNSIRRGTTAALNGRLIPLLRELISTVRHTLAEMGVAAPLMVVRGDGSLVRAEWALARPIETILSGPAASMVGAWHLAGSDDAAAGEAEHVWVVDVGGTTTDIATLRDGRPYLNPEGAQVGAWRTMVEAVDAHTVGLGGDSLVQVGKEGGLAIGPRRVIPLCMLAEEYPAILEVLREQVIAGPNSHVPGQFALARRQRTSSLSGEDRKLLARLADGPRALSDLIQQMRYISLALRRIERLESEQGLLRSAFTPTDALHVLGRFELWDGAASRLGADLLAAQLGLSPVSLCEQVVRGVSDRVSRALVSKVLLDEAAFPRWEREPTAEALLDRALGNNSASNLECRMTLRHPIIAVGAPVAAYMPRVACQLNTKLVIPPRAEVANAVGAVAGGVVLRQRVLIRPLAGDRRVRLHLPDGPQDFPTQEAAVRHAQQVVAPRLMAQAQQAGANQVEVQMVREDREAPVKGGWGDKIYLETELRFTAVGRPSPAEGNRSSEEIINQTGR